MGGAHLHYVNSHKANIEWKEMKTFEVTDYTNLVSLKCWGQTDWLTEGQTEWPQTDGQSGPTTRPAFTKATQIKIRPLSRQYISLFKGIWIFSRRSWAANFSVPDPTLQISNPSTVNYLQE